jgi:hypothetical protein
MPFRVHVCCAAHCSQTNPVGHACSMCRLLSHDACALQRAFLHLHVSSRVWASRCISESAVLPRLSATQNHAWPFHPVTQTQSPCALFQYSTCMIDAISCECIQDARVLRRARLAIPSPTLAVCVDLVTRDSGSLVHVARCRPHDMQHAPHETRRERRQHCMYVAQNQSARSERWFSQQNK